MPKKEDEGFPLPLRPKVQLHTSLRTSVRTYRNRTALVYPRLDRLEALGNKNQLLRIKLRMQIVVFVLVGLGLFPDKLDPAIVWTGQDRNMVRGGQNYICTVV